MSIMNKRKETQEGPKEVETPVRVLSESEKAQYGKCKICVHSYWWSDSFIDPKDLECRFLRESKVLVALKPGIKCELFEENLGCMHCTHRRSEPKMLVNGEKLVLCERMRDAYGGPEVNLGWERVDKEEKCSSYCRKEDE